MGDHSAIEWTDATWNPLVGCSVVSPGCTNCYAMKMAARLERMGSDRYAGLTQASKAGPVWTGQVRLVEPALAQPLRWRKPRRIFVNSMSDLFHESVTDDQIDRVFAVMALAPQHTFQVLTKRAARMRAYMTVRQPDARRNLPHLWLGASAEDRLRWQDRVRDLLRTPAAIRFVSLEPLLGPIDTKDVPYGDGVHGVDALTGQPFLIEGAYPAAPLSVPTPRLDWLIAGGESGPGARPMHPDWARGLRDQCAAAGVPFFFKQWGAWGPSWDGTTENARRQIWLRRNGVQQEVDEPEARFDDAAILYPWRSAIDGRRLDGRTHDDMPEGNR